MVQLEQLQVLVDELKKWATQAQNATERSAVDEAKVKGLRTYQQLSRQVNRAYHELQTITNTRRAELTTVTYHQARAVATASQNVAETPTGVETPKPAENIETPPKATAKKSTKKTTKKAKK